METTAMGFLSLWLTNGTPAALRTEPAGTAGTPALADAGESGQKPRECSRATWRGEEVEQRPTRSRALGSREQRGAVGPRRVDRDLLPRCRRRVVERPGIVGEVDVVRARGEEGRRAHLCRRFQGRLGRRRRERDDGRERGADRRCRDDRRRASAGTAPRLWHVAATASARMASCDCGGRCGPSGRGRAKGRCSGAAVRTCPASAASSSVQRGRKVGRQRRLALDPLARDRVREREPRRVEELARQAEVALDAVEPVAGRPAARSRRGGRGSGAFAPSRAARAGARARAAARRPRSA